MEKDEAIKSLKEILSEPLIWYEKNKDDQGLIYDDSYTWFSHLSRGDCQAILEILSKVI